MAAAALFIMNIAYFFLLSFRLFHWIMLILFSSVCLLSCEDALDLFFSVPLPVRISSTQQQQQHQSPPDVYLYTINLSIFHRPTSNLCYLPFAHSLNQLINSINSYEFCCFFFISVPTLTHIHLHCSIGGGQRLRHLLHLHHHQC